MTSLHGLLKMITVKERKGDTLEMKYWIFPRALFTYNVIRTLSQRKIRRNDRPEGSNAFKN